MDLINSYDLVQPPVKRLITYAVPLITRLAWLLPVKVMVPLKLYDPLLLLPLKLNVALPDAITPPLLGIERLLNTMSTLLLPLFRSPVFLVKLPARLYSPLRVYAAVLPAKPLTVKVDVPPSVLLSVGPSYDPVLVAVLLTLSGTLLTQLSVWV